MVMGTGAQLGEPASGGQHHQGAITLSQQTALHWPLTSLTWPRVMRGVVTGHWSVFTSCAAIISWSSGHRMSSISSEQTVHCSWYFLSAICLTAMFQTQRGLEQMESTKFKSPSQQTVMWANCDNVTPDLAAEDYPGQDYKTVTGKMFVQRF